MKLHKLSPAKGSKKKKKRIGRGVGSGIGTTSGKGNKGQQSRSGYSRSFKEGGQMPLYRRVPKSGFSCPSRTVYREINLDALSMLLEKGGIKNEGIVKKENLVQAGVARKKDQIKILGRGEGLKITLEVDAVSNSAQEKIEKSGGKVVLISQSRV